MDSTEQCGLNLERAVDHIRTEFSRAGVEIVGCNTNAIHVTMPPDFEDVTHVLIDLKQRFGLHADYRFCTETKLGMLILGYDGDDDGPSASPAMQLPTTPSSPGSEYATLFFGFTTAALSMLTATLVLNWPKQILAGVNGTFFV